MMAMGIDNFQEKKRKRNRRSSVSDAEKARREALVIQAAEAILREGGIPSIDAVCRRTCIQRTSSDKAIKRLAERGEWPYAAMCLDLRQEAWKRQHKDRLDRAAKVAAEMFAEGRVVSCLGVSDRAKVPAEIVRRWMKGLKSAGKWKYGPSRQPGWTQPVVIPATPQEVAENIKAILPEYITDAQRAEERAKRTTKRKAAELAYVMGEHNPRLEASIIARAEWRRAVKGCEKLRDEVKRRLEAKHDRHFLPTAGVDCSGGRVGCAGDPGVDLVREGA